MTRTKRKTRIIATAGPQRGRDPTGLDQTQPAPDILETFIAAGVDVIRFNMSHGIDPEKWNLYLKPHLDWLKSNRNGTASSVTVLGHLPGPKIHLSEVTPEKGTYITSNDEVFLNFGIGPVPHGQGSANVAVSGKPFAEAVTQIDEFANIGTYLRARDTVNILLGDGMTILRALSEEGGIVRCQVVTGGELRRGMSVHFSSAHLPGPSLRVCPFGDQDQMALKFLLDQGAEFLGYIAVPFAQYEEDVAVVRSFITNWYAEQFTMGTEKPRILATVETGTGWRNADLLLDVADGVIVARNSINLYVSPEQTPRIQKSLIRKCIAQHKLAFVATGVVASMMENLRPTMEESTDVFNAVLDGCDGIILSGETSVGRYPIETINVIARVIDEAEAFREESGGFEGAKGHLRMSGNQIDRQYHSVFVSYGGPDKTFSERLSEVLEREGINTYLFSKDAKPGMKLHHLMRDGVNEYDRVILVCSRSSLDRPGVLNELEEVLQREARQGGASILIPITLDDYVFEHWKPQSPGLAQSIRDRVVADFRGADTDEVLFRRATNRLLEALRRTQ
jgi:pyruvate kinase